MSEIAKISIENWGIIILIIWLIVFFLIKPKNKKNPLFNTNKKTFNLKFLQKYSTYTKNYREFHIPKRDWTQRLIETPNEKLKNIQKDVLINLDRNFIFPSYVTAFRKGNWVKNNAQKHIGKKIIINIDIKDYFHSITEDKIKEALSSYKWLLPEEIGKLVDITTYKWRLAQWAPTSPFIANLVFLWIDTMIIKLLKKYDTKVWYSRYADDITFSSDNPRIQNAIRIITDSLLPKYWYTAKKKKTCIYRSHTKQLVTWLVVNKRVSYPRNKYMTLRAMVYNFLKNGDWDKNKIKWYLSFLKSVDSEKYNKLKFYYKREFKFTNNYELLFKKWKKKYKRWNFINPRTGEKVSMF